LHSRRSLHSNHVILSLLNFASSTVKRLRKGAIFSVKNYYKNENLKSFVVTTGFAGKASAPAHAPYLHPCRQRHRVLRLGGLTFVPCRYSGLRRICKNNSSFGGRQAFASQLRIIRIQAILQRIKSHPFRRSLFFNAGYGHINHADIFKAATG